MNELMIGIMLFIVFMLWVILITLFIKNKKKEEVLDNTPEVLAKIDSLSQNNLQLQTQLRTELDQKLTISFSSVQKNLNTLYEQFGIVKQLSGEVTSLNRVFANAKTRGNIGEVQLKSLISDILSPTQYKEQYNLALDKVNEQGGVDFAILLPEGILPIDSKFPLDAYNELLNAYEINDPALISATKNKLYTAVKTEAKSISSKYIIPPKTLNFAIMFLPSENVFAELQNNPLVVDSIRREYNIELASPSTLVALLNSLKMGFQNLQIQKSAKQVMDILSSVTQEFNRFEDALESAQKHIDAASKDVSNLITTRSNKMRLRLQEADKLDGIEDLKIDNSND